MATVEGGIGECGDAAYPGIFVQIDDQNPNIILNQFNLNLHFETCCTDTFF